MRLFRFLIFVILVLSYSSADLNVAHAAKSIDPSFYVHFWIGPR